MRTTQPSRHIKTSILDVLIPNCYRNPKEDSATISFNKLRNTVGILGMTLPFVLFVGDVILSRTLVVRESISCYYHTAMRDCFVGVLWTFALVLFYYNPDDYEDWSTTLAAVCALGLSLCPTQRWNCNCELGYSSATLSTMHYIFASTFFLTLSYISIVLFTRRHRDHATVNSTSGIESLKDARNVVYRLCGYIMLSCVALIALYNLIGYSVSQNSLIQPVFLCECVALIAFGVSWIIKGKLYFLRDKFVSVKDRKR